MKNLISLISEDDVHDYVSNLWRSPAFIASYKNRGFIYDQVEKFAWLPRFFAESSNDHLERAHFCTWWNVIMLREDYTNPIIHDLYYLHEMAHAASMPYIEGIGRAAFDEKMQRNELEASVLSEILVYFEMPELRAQSFDHSIYADRFLSNPNMQSLWRANPAVAAETIRSMRRDVMVSKPEHLMDTTELWIRRFAEQNEAYSITWADRFGEIENQLAMFQSMASRDTGWRAVAAHDLGEWLKTQAECDPVDHVPFREEAELFAPFYWSNKEKYAKAVAQS